MADCLFSKIVAGEIPAFKVYEDDETLAFLDINPAAGGHTLVIPKKHSQDIFDIEERYATAVAATVKRIAQKIRSELGADVSVLQNNGRSAGQAIAHMYAHVIPRKPDDKIVLAHLGAPASKEDLAAMQEKIQLSSTVPVDYQSRIKSALSQWDEL